jgi:four helix bundle protein
MQDYRKLSVWKKSHVLTKAVYQATNMFPKDEMYSLTSQIRRASVSIPANIAEGCGRGSQPEFGRFLQIASGSASELQYLLFLTAELNYLSPEDSGSLIAQIDEVKRMLSVLMNKIKT